MASDAAAVPGAPGGSAPSAAGSSASGAAEPEPPQPGFLAAVFRDLGAEIPEQFAGPDAPSPHRPAREARSGRPAPAPDDSAPHPHDRPHQQGRQDAEQQDGEEDEIAAHGRAAALAHHRTMTVRAEHDRLADLLRRAALPVSAMDFESQLRRYEPRPFPADTDAPAADAEPRWADYAPVDPVPATPDEPPSRRLLDSSYQRELAQARLRHQRALREWRAGRAESVTPGLRSARQAHEQAEQLRATAVHEYNQSLEECRRAYRKAEPAAVESLLERALAAAEGATQDLPAPCRALFRPLTSTALLDLDLPSPDLVPSLAGYRLAAEGAVEPVPRPQSDRSSDYLRLVARLALRALQAADAVDTDGILAGVVLNGWLRRPGAEPLCLLSVDADRDALARTRLLPADPAGHADPARQADPSEAVAHARTASARTSGALPVHDDEPADGVYSDAEHDEALVRLRELAAVVTPDPYGPVPVRPNGTASAAVPSTGELSSNEFAVLVRELLTRGGLGAWSVRLRGPGGLVATAEGAAHSALPGRWVVWASRGADPVAAEELRTLAEAVREEGAERGLRLTTGGFEEAALDLAAEEGYRRIHLIDGAGVQELSHTHLGMPLATNG
ncbi:restriction endonuclease [Kitasatospora paranensis]|uniref:Restriction endonuclease n=1 Tax=Kitasatospora paranensis TaxID=258053 RepID=A0ABW2G6R4_9ACTN